MGRLLHLLPMEAMVGVGVIKIPAIGSEGVEVGEGVDEVAVMEGGEVVLGREVDEVVVVAAEVVVVVLEEEEVAVEEGVVEGEGAEATFPVREEDMCRGVGV